MVWDEPGLPRGAEAWAGVARHAAAEVVRAVVVRRAAAVWAVVVRHAVAEAVWAAAGVLRPEAADAAGVPLAVRP